MIKRPPLDGGISPQEWLKHQAKADHKKQATWRAFEAEVIASYIDLLECGFRPE